jgi:hypothetical protein
VLPADSHELFNKRVALGLAAALLILIAFTTTPEPAAGQAAVSLSRAGQEDVSFWVNHNGLIQFDVEGEVGFGDFARILLRRRSNAESIRQLRDRFTFSVQDPAAINTPDVFRVELANGTIAWRSSPQLRFTAGSSRTVSVPLLLVNRDASEASFDAAYTGASMTSAARQVVVPPRSSTPVFLRAVETNIGPAEGKLTVRHAEAEISASVHFDIRPLVPVRVRVIDERGRPSTARLYITGSDGLAYAPRGSSARITAMSAEYFFHADESFEIDLPAGDTLLEGTRGPEYRVTSQRIDLKAGGPAELTLKLARWTHVAQQGWWSGDVHIHANYTSPHHQVIEPRDVRLQVASEDLNYGNMMVANSGGAFIHDRQYFEAKPHRLSMPEYFIYWNEENRSSAYGHMCFLGLKRLVEPFYNGFRNTPHWDDYPSNYALAQQVFDQGGAVSYAHPGMSPSFEGASIKELPVDLALGQRTAMDVLSNNDETATTEMWYRLLNCGFRVGISAGTDAFTNVADHYLAGGNRVYVRTGEKFDYTAWLEGFRRGQSFASNGPVAFVTVNGKLPGDEIRLEGPGQLDVRASVASQVPLDRIDLIVNGQVAHTVKPGAKETIEFTHSLPVKESVWIALRALGPRHRLILNDTAAYAHTSPVYVTVAGRPVRVADDLRFYREWVERLIARADKNGRFATPERKAEVLALFRKGLEWYQRAESGTVAR